MKLVHLIDAYKKTHYINATRILQIEEIRSDRSRIHLTDGMSIDINISAHDVFSVIMSSVEG